MHKLQLFTGEPSPLAERVARQLNVKLSSLDVRRYSNGEERVKMPDGVRGDNVFLIQSTGGDPYRILRLCHMADAAWHASARRVIAVVPEFGWARMDSMHEDHSSLGASLAIRLMRAAGVNHIVAMDLHKDAIELAAPQGMPFDKLYASPVFSLELQRLLTLYPDLAILVPDAGAMPRALYYSNRYNLPMVVIHKQRDRQTGKTRIVQIVGELTPKQTVVSFDDMIDTGGTIIGIDTEMRERFTWRGEHHIFATHGILSGDAIGNLNDSGITSINITDTVVHAQAVRIANLPKFRIHSVAEIFANAILTINNEQGSIGKMFK